MSISAATQTTFSVTPQQIPAAPVFGAITQLPTPLGSVTVVVNVPTLDISFVALTSGNLVKFMTLFWSENPLPIGATGAQLASMPQNVVFRQRVPITGTTPHTFTVDGLLQGQIIYFAADAEN